MLRKFSEVGLTMNKNKYEFNRNSFTLLVSVTGISADPKKVKIIYKANPHVRSLLGMIIY